MSKNKKNSLPDLPRVCEFCECATLIHDDNNVLCSQKGIVNREYCCRKFIYDPLKRAPRTLPPLPKLSEDDLLL